MMKFVDGPAAGQTLMMRRCPVLLRVVRNPLARGKEREWDCLNYSDDVAKPHEEIHLYILRERPQMVHLRMSPRSSSGFYGSGNYHHLAETVDDVTVRVNARWEAWCDANQERLMPSWYREQLAAKAREGEPHA